MNTVKILITIMLYCMAQFVSASEIYRGRATRKFVWNDQTYALFDRAGFPSLENGQSYRVVYVVTWDNGVKDTCTIYATYSCNLDDSEMQDIMGYVDDGTLADWDESAGFFHIIQDAPFDPEDPGYDDWEPENPGLPTDYGFDIMFTFHFEYSCATEPDNVEVIIYDE